MYTYHSKSFAIYEYKCHCDCRYVGRTSQRLQDRIKQHVPQWLRQQLTRPRPSQPHRSCKQNDTKPDSDSAIGQHLLENEQCVINYANKWFSILATSRSFFHLNLLEAIMSRPGTWCYADRNSLCTLSNTFDNRGVFIRPLAALSLAFRQCEIFVHALYTTSAIIG